MPFRLGITLLNYWPSLWATHLASLLSNRIRYVKTPLGMRQRFEGGASETEIRGSSKCSLKTNHESALQSHAPSGAYKAAPKMPVSTNEHGTTAEMLHPRVHVEQLLKFLHA